MPPPARTSRVALIVVAVISAGDPLASSSRTCPIRVTSTRTHPAPATTPAAPAVSAVTGRIRAAGPAPAIATSAVGTMMNSSAGSHGSPVSSPVIRSGRLAVTSPLVVHR